MSQFRLTRTGLLAAAIVISTVTAMVGPGNVAHAETLRAEINAPLTRAHTLIGQNKFKEALASLAEADAAPNKTRPEILVIERARARAAQGAGLPEVAAKSYEWIRASGMGTSAEIVSIDNALASLYLTMRNWPQAIMVLSRQVRNTGSPEARADLVMAYFRNGDAANAKNEAFTLVTYLEKLGRAPTQDTLNVLVASALKLGDKAGYVDALEKFVTWYPSPTAWGQLLMHVPTVPGFAPRLSLDVWRLKLALGQIKKADDFMDMTSLALQAGTPAEGLKIIETAYQVGAFGPGADADRQQRLKDQASMAAARSVANADSQIDIATRAYDDDTVMNLGLGLVTAGKADKGLQVMNEAFKRGYLKRPNEARLHIAFGQVWAGKNADAATTFKTVQGADGAAALARYWLLYLKSQ